MILYHPLCGFNALPNWILGYPNLHLRLVALPAYSPDFNADEAVWDWAREEVTCQLPCSVYCSPLAS